MDEFENMKRIIQQEKIIVAELDKNFNFTEDKGTSPSEKDFVLKHRVELVRAMGRNNLELRTEIEKINLFKRMAVAGVEVAKPSPITLEVNKKKQKYNFELEELEKITLDRIRKKRKEKIIDKKEQAPNQYIAYSNKIFGEFSKKLAEGGNFDSVKRDLVKSSLPFLLKSYISVILLTTLISFILAIGIFVVALTMSVSSGNIFKDIITWIWIPIIIPVATFFLVYFYPSLEKKSLENKIDSELPFATIHMAAIAGSMIEPSKTFEILSSTKEYPTLEKEFNKIANEMNLFGKDFVTALRTVAFNSPSKRFSELLNGLSVTITSGGDLAEFFDKRAANLLFDYRLEREKEAKSAETFMDIYISVVIAAPMILMLLLMIMKLSGIGISLSTTALTLIICSIVAGINIGFLMLLQLRQKE